MIADTSDNNNNESPLPANRDTSHHATAAEEGDPILATFEKGGGIGSINTSNVGDAASDFKSISQNRNVATIDDTGACSEVGGIQDPSILNVNESLDEEPAIDVSGGRPTHHGAALNTSYAESRPWRGGPGGKAQSVGAMSGVGGGRHHKLRTKPGTTVHMGRPGKMSSGGAIPV